MTPHWHDSNPWADSVRYIPIELAAALCAYERTPEATLEHWRQYGPKLDAYILPQPSGLHCLGVRFGPRGPDYLSPGTNEARAAIALAAWQAGYDAAHAADVRAMIAGELTIEELESNP